MGDNMAGLRGTLYIIMRFAMLHWRAQMAYPLSFYMLVTAHFLGIFLEMVAILALFDRFGELAGWSWNNLAILYGIMHMSFATAELFGRGFDTFSQIVRTGEFDRFLVRPCSPFLQVAVREFQFMRLGRFFQGLMVFTWGLMTSQISISGMDAALLLMAYLGTTSLFYGLFIIQATLSFWTVESLELMNITTYGGLEAGQYPMTLFPNLLRAFFIGIIPFSCTAYIPIAVLTGHQDLPFAMAFCLPLVGGLFLLLAICFWQKGVRHYSSTGT